MIISTLICKGLTCPTFDQDFLVAKLRDRSALLELEGVEAGLAVDDPGLCCAWVRHIFVMSVLSLH